MSQKDIKVVHPSGFDEPWFIILDWRRSFFTQTIHRKIGGRIIIVKSSTPPPPKMRCPDVEVWFLVLLLLALLFPLSSESSVDSSLDLDGDWGHQDLVLDNRVDHHFDHILIEDDLLVLVRPHWEIPSEAL